MKGSKNSMGFTLIEVLASLVILSIIILSFSSFLTQTALFNNKNKESFQGINLSRQLLHNLQDTNSDIQNFLDDKTQTSKNDLDYSNLNMKEDIQYINNDSNEPEPYYLLILEDSNNSDIEYFIKIYETVSYDLYKTKIEVRDVTEDEEHAHTFGYIEDY